MAALDLGSLECRFLQRDGSRLVGRRIAPIFCEVPDRFASESGWVDVKSPIVRCGERRLLLGDLVWESARLFPAALEHLLPEGIVPTNDPLRRQLLAGLLDSLITEPSRSGEPCAIVLPSGLGDGADAGIGFVSRVVGLKGYTPEPISVEQAACLADLAGSGYSGIVVHLGASGTRIGRFLHSRRIGSATIDAGRSSLEFSLASELGLTRFTADGVPLMDCLRVSRWLRKTSPDDELDRHATGPTTDRLASWADRILEAVANLVEDTTPPAIMLSGCSLRVRGFRDLLHGRFTREYPAVPIRIASSKPFALARGGVIHTQFDNVTTSSRAA